MRMKELSNLAVRIACAYLYNVISYAEGLQVTNSYGHVWEPFEPLMSEIEEEAGIKRNKSPLWRMEIWTEFREKRLDNTFGKLGEIFELLSDDAYRRMHEMASMFPPDRWANLTASIKFDEKIVKTSSSTQLVEVKPEFRLWSIDELSKVEVGTKFFHKSYGECQIVESGGDRKMQFGPPLGPEYPVAFFSQAFPWNEEMKRVV